MYRDKTTGQYPISKQELVSSNPNISLPAAWTDEVLEILGVDYVKPVAKPEITSIQRLVEGAPEQREDGGWYQTWVIQDFTEEEISNLIIQKKIEKKSSVEVKRDALLKTGYTFTFEEQILTLQTRDDEDRINWLGILNASTSMVMASKGDDLTKIRTAENVVITLSFSAAQILMLQTLAYQSSIYESSWTHKDDVDKLTALEEVLAYDVETGWPS